MKNPEDNSMNSEKTDSLLGREAESELLQGAGRQQETSNFSISPEFLEYPEDLEVNWVLPDIEKEMGEIERTANELEENLKSKKQDLGQHKQNSILGDEAESELLTLKTEENKSKGGSVESQKESLMLEKLMEAVSNAILEELDDSMWQKLKNTDSYYNVRPKHLEDAIEKVEDYNKSLPEGNKRDWKDTLAGMKKGRPMKSPIILIKPNGIPYLVAGNTRLMLSRAMEVTPKVLVVNLKNRKA